MNALSPALADALASTALSSTGPDASIIAASAAYGRVHADAEDAITDKLQAGLTDDEMDDVVDGIMEARDARQAPNLDAMLAQPVTTLAGLRALATSLLTWNACLAREREGDDEGDRLLAHLLRSLTAPIGEPGAVIGRGYGAGA